MDQEVAALLQKIKQTNRPPFWQGSPAQARSGPTLTELLFGPAPAVGRVEDFHIASSLGYELPVRLYVPSALPRGIIVYLHGGGWVMGSVAGSHPLAATLANRSGFAVLSVDYRLAPECAFPLPLDDARAALQWASRDAETRIGAPLGSLVVMGDSAGANLATIAARLHNESFPESRVDLQVLAYPVTGSDFDTASYHAFAEGYLLTRKDMMWFWDQYLPDVSLRCNPLASPIATPDLSASPPALILTAGFDPLRDEGEAYGQLLSASGVAATVVRCDGLTHGFLAMINFAPSASAAFDRILAAIDEISTTLGKPVGFSA